VRNRCLKIDASKIENTAVIYVDIIMPYIDSLYLYSNACAYTPTNIWLKKLCIENYSNKKSTIYINSTACSISIKGFGETIIAGIIDALNLTVEGKTKSNVEVISRFVKIIATNETFCYISGNSFHSEYYSSDNAIIDASMLVSGKVTALAQDKSLIHVKSEDRPVIVLWDKGKILYNSPSPILPDSSGVNNIKPEK